MLSLARHRSNFAKGSTAAGAYLSSVLFNVITRAYGVLGTVPELLMPALCPPELWHMLSLREQKARAQWLDTEQARWLLDAHYTSHRDVMYAAVLMNPGLLRTSTVG